MKKVQEPSRICTLLIRVNRKECSGTERVGRRGVHYAPHSRDSRVQFPGAGADGRAGVGASPRRRYARHVFDQNRHLVLPADRSFVCSDRECKRQRVLKSWGSKEPTKSISATEGKTY